MATPQSALDLVQYLHLKLAALGQPAAKNSPDARFLQIAKPLLRNHYEKERLLGKHLCPADARIQSFLDAYLADCCPGGAPRLPASTFILDRAGLARAMSLPPDADVFSSPYVRSYRVPQGVLHNPASDRRTTRGVFHIAEGGFPIPADKQAAPRQGFGALLAAALRPARAGLTLPLTPAGVSGNGKRRPANHGDALFRSRQPGEQSGLRRSDLRQRRRSTSSGKRRRTGRGPLDRSHRLRNPGSASGGHEENRARPAACRRRDRSPAPRRHVLERSRGAL